MLQLRPPHPAPLLLLLLLPQQPLISLHLRLQAALGGQPPAPRVKPPLLWTDGTPLPLSSPLSRCHQSAGAGPKPQPSAKPRWTGFKSSFISSRHVQFRHHQYVASEGTTSTFFFVFSFFLTCSKKQDRMYPRQACGRLKDTVCATIQTSTIKKKVFKMSFALSVLAAIYLSTHSSSIHLPFYQEWNLEIQGAGLWLYSALWWQYTALSAKSSSWLVFG